MSMYSCHVISYEQQQRNATQLNSCRECDWLASHTRSGAAETGHTTQNTTPRLAKPPRGLTLCSIPARPLGRRCRQARHNKASNSIPPLPPTPQTTSRPFRPASSYKRLERRKTHTQGSNQTEPTTTATTSDRIISVLLCFFPPPKHQNPARSPNPGQAPGRASRNAAASGGPSTGGTAPRCPKICGTAPPRRASPASTARDRSEHIMMKS